MTFVLNVVLVNQNSLTEMQL